MRKRQMTIKLVAVSAILAGLVLISINAGGGSLEPNAPPGPTMHTLEDIYNVVASGTGSPPQTTAVDMFLKIDGVPGGSTDDKHKDWIEILSYSHGISQPAALQADHEDFSVVKVLDKASPKLALFCCNGQHIPYVQLQFSRATDTNIPVMDYKLTDVMVTSVRPNGNVVQVSYPLPMEEVTFNYGKIEWTYTEPNGTTVHTGWDLVANKSQ